MPNINFSISLDQANIILGALGKAPYEVVAPVIAELQKQAAPQLEAAQAPVSPTPLPVAPIANSEAAPPAA